MCYHKSQVEKFNELMDHYSASFHSIKGDLEAVKERLAILMRKDDRLGSLNLNE
jgi:hypothetical protein